MSNRIKSAVLAPDIVRSTKPPVGWGYDEVAQHIGPRLALRTIASDTVPDVLEAGGGSSAHVTLPPNARITTIDISSEQLAKNTHAHEKLLGDLQTFDYGSRRYDLIVCWDVLEHLAFPIAAVERFARILRPGGQVVIVGPLPATLKGFLTKYTPHAVHVAFYRHALGSPTAGLPGHFPFPTQHAQGADPRQIAVALERYGLTIESLTFFESTHVSKLRDWSVVLYRIYRASEWAFSVLSLGRYARGITDFCLIAQCPPALPAKERSSDDA